MYGRPPLQADAVDPKSRHKGKLETESLLTARGVNWTSIRPVYIYGPLNYNPVEEWFFHRLKAGRPIPIPGAGNQITQLGHVKDLATAFNLVLGNPKASQQIFNISGAKYVTFDGLARACAKVTRFRERNCTGFLLNCLGWVLLSSVFSNFSNGCDCLMRAGWRVP